MRRLKKRYKRPKVPYNSTQIKDEKALLKKYGLRRKKEIWIAREMLRRYRQRARELIAVKNPENETVLLERLAKIGILSKGTGLDDVLGLTVENILDRRLQTVVFNAKLATTPIQARQSIVHGHITIDGRQVSFPSYIVPVEEESRMKSSFNPPEKKAVSRGVTEKPDDKIPKDGKGAPAEEVPKAAEPPAEEAVKE